MKMVNREIRAGCLLLALIVIAALFAGCRKDEYLRGMDIVVGNWWSDYDVDTRVPISDMEERTLEYRRRIQQEHGFRMRERNIATWDQIAQLAATSIMAGRPAAQVFILQPDRAIALLNQNLLYPVSESSAVDFTSSTPVNWNRDTIETFTFNGNTYAFSVGYGSSQGASGVFFNKRLFREAGIDPELPYDMQRDGTWTWDVFLDLCRRLTRDSNNTGIIDTFAMTADFSTSILNAVVFSNGAHFVSRDADGKFVNATGTPEFLQALQFAIRLKDEGVLLPKPENANWDWYRSFFQDGQVAMMVEEQYVAGGLRTMTDDWGFVLFPKGPSSADYRFGTSENVMVIPGTFSPEEVDRILYALQLWHTPVDTDPDAWKETFYSVFRDFRAIDETLAMIRDRRYSTFRNHYIIPGLNQGDIAWSMWWWEGNPAQLIESVSQSWDAIIAEANIIHQLD